MNKKRLFFRYILPMHIVQLITAVLPNTDITTKIRGKMMRPFFKSCGTNFRIGMRVVINRPDLISIGDDVYIAHQCYLNGTGGLTIEDGVSIGPMCVIVTSKHVYQNGAVSMKSEAKSVVIGKGAWLASHAVINAGVTVSSGTTVGANAVVTKNFEQDAIIGGVPAKFIRNQKEHAHDIH
ncbi:acyltransferase [Listeria booriae]|uniref:acyltransferase n=1 Tax=Listeria booriae TaxID=1552123 RepID=UPI001623D1FB|nr:acyltransferase [Listeria booriae]MBC2320368.1 acyltransferase [Listeria booriae]